MALQTTIPTSYSRIKGRRKVNQFMLQKQMNWRNYPFSIKDREFLSTKDINHLLKISKDLDFASFIGNVFKVCHFKNSVVDSIQNKYDFVYPLSARQKSSKITPSMPPVLRKRIQELERLEAGWDSYSASPISNKAIEASISLLTQISHKLGSQFVEDVFIAPCADSSIQLEWEFNSKELILKIVSNGKQILYLFVSSSGEEREGTITSQGEIESLLQETLQP